MLSKIRNSSNYINTPAGRVCRKEQGDNNAQKLLLYCYNPRIEYIMKSRNIFLLIVFTLTVLFLCSCHNGKRNDTISDTDFVILNKSLSDELDTLVSELENFDIVFKDFLKYIRGDFDPKRCNILVSISIHNGDTLVDFSLYDTLYNGKLVIVPFVGSFKSANGIKIQFADDGCLTKGVLYETQQGCHRLPIVWSNALQKPMVLRNGKLIMNPPPLCED